MTPTTPLAGVLIGLLDGLIVAALIMIAVQVANRRQRSAPLQRPVAEDGPVPAITSTPEAPVRLRKVA